MWALILLALLGSSHAVPRPSRNIQRIIGGELASEGQFPFMSNVQHGWFGTWWIQFCGGSLLTTTTVLSAAHCFEDHDEFGFTWRVLLGTTHSTEGGSPHPISEIIMHPQYDNPFLDNDVAILRLLIAAVYSPTVQPARIAGSNYVAPDNGTVTTIGWGAMSVGGWTTDDLRYVDVNVINQELCAERYASLAAQPGIGRIPIVSDGMLCAGIIDVGGKDACQGDSGGPLAHEGDVIIGVVSWGYRCAEAQYPGVYARVSYYIDWILENGQ